MNETTTLGNEETSLPGTGSANGEQRSRVLVTGANGQLGRALMALLPQAGFAPTGVDLPEVDISDTTAMSTWDWSNYDVVINAAAWTNVDGAETPEGRLRRRHAGPHRGGDSFATGCLRSVQGRRRRRRQRLPAPLPGAHILGGG